MIINVINDHSNNCVNSMCVLSLLWSFSAKLRKNSAVRTIPLSGSWHTFQFQTIEVEPFSMRGLITV